MSAPVLSRPRNQSTPRVVPGASKEGRAIRGVVFGLLLAIPFWLVLAIVVRWAF